MFNKLDISKTSGVSPIVGVIVLVVIAVVLSASVGVSVFNLGQDSPQESSISGVSIDETPEEGTVSVQMVTKGTSENVIVKAGNTTKRLNSPG